MFDKWKKREYLSKMCMNVLIVKSLIAAFEGIIVEFGGFVMINERSNHVFDKDCFDISME